MLITIFGEIDMINKKYVDRFLMGFLITDGHIDSESRTMSVTQSSRETYHLNVGKPQFLINLKNVIEELYPNAKVYIRPYKGKKANNTGVIPENHTLVIKNLDHILNKFNHWGFASDKTDSMTKHHLSKILDECADKFEKVCFVYGMLIGDGIWNKDGSMGYCSKLKKVCEGMQHVIKDIVPNAQFSKIFTRNKKKKDRNKTTGFGRSNSFTIKRHTTKELLYPLFTEDSLKDILQLTECINHKMKTLDNIGLFKHDALHAGGMNSFFY